MTALMAGIAIVVFFIDNFDFEYNFGCNATLTFLLYAVILRDICILWAFYFLL